MLQKVMQDVRGDAIAARDGMIGSVEDAYFDDERWSVRYLVVDTRRWLPGRKVLISPVSIEKEGNAPRHSIRVGLSREQVERSPAADTAPPVSRQFEKAHARYYAFNLYWAGPYWGAFPLPGSAAERADSAAFREMKAAERKAAQSHLRSTRAVVGHRVEASDGPIGHVDDLIVDDEAWAVAGVVVDTRNWLPGRKVIVAPCAVRAIDWLQKKVLLGMSRAEVRNAPASP